MRADQGRGIEGRERAFLETPPLIGKDLTLILRADSTAPVFNDEEKRARATTQVQKVAREGYRFDAGGLAKSTACDRAITLVAGARHVGTSSFPRTCQRSHKRFAPSCGPSGPVVRPKSCEAIPFVSRWGLTRSHRAAKVQSPQPSPKGPGPTQSDSPRAFSAALGRYDVRALYSHD